MITKLNWSVLAALLLLGCSAAPTMKDAVDVTPDSRIAFGSAEVWSGDKQETWGMKWMGANHFYLVILPPGSDEAITYRLDDDGAFFWALEPGEYLLVGYHWSDEGVQQTGGIGSTFVVPESGGDVYLGTIVFHAFGPYLMPRFEDRFATLAAQYDARFPARRGTSVKLLLEAAEPVGNFANLRGECDEHWRIECDKRFQGITPIAPRVSQSGFPTVGSLTPEFRWKPCPKDGVSYDFVLYEAAAYSFDQLTPLYMKGRIVAYEEGLAESSWQPDKPLRPDTRYFWSVRMREGDTVSHWSTQSHSTFLLVYMSWSAGQWFQFKTG